jgi:hypothetical protein
LELQHLLVLQFLLEELELQEEVVFLMEEVEFLLELEEVLGLLLSLLPPDLEKRRRLVSLLILEVPWMERRS